MKKEKEIIEENTNGEKNKYLDRQNVKAFYEFDTFEFMQPDENGLGLSENNIVVAEKEMLDKDGKETENLDEAVSIVTDYLSKEQEKTAGANLLKAFDGEKLDYRDVKVAFEVTEPNTSDRILINQAQISKDSDKDGNDVTDQDSVPDKWNEGEDDQDIEKVKVQYFDLSLRKWVTQAIVTENGEEKIIESGHKAEDDPEDVVKVDLKKSKINTIMLSVILYAVS